MMFPIENPSEESTDGEALVFPPRKNLFRPSRRPSIFVDDDVPITATPKKEPDPGTKAGGPCPGQLQQKNAATEKDHPEIPDVLSELSNRALTLLCSGDLLQSSRCLASLLQRAELLVQKRLADPATYHGVQVPGPNRNGQDAQKSVQKEKKETGDGKEAAAAEEEDEEEEEEEEEEDGEQGTGRLMRELRARAPWTGGLISYWVRAFPLLRVWAGGRVWARVSAVLLSFARQLYFHDPTVARLVAQHLSAAVAPAHSFSQQQPEVGVEGSEEHSRLLTYLGQALVPPVDQLEPTCFSGLDEFRQNLQRSLLQSPGSDRTVRSALLYGSRGCGKGQLAGCVQALLKEQSPGKDGWPMYRVHCADLEYVAGSAEQAATMLSQLWQHVRDDQCVLLLEEVGRLGSAAIQKLRFALRNQGEAILLLTCSHTPDLTDETADVRKFLEPVVRTTQFVDMPRAEVRSSIIEQAIARALQLDGPGETARARLKQLHQNPVYQKCLHLVTAATGADWKLVTQLLRDSPGAGEYSRQSCAYLLLRFSPPDKIDEVLGWIRSDTLARLKFRAYQLKDTLRQQEEELRATVSRVQNGALRIQQALSQVALEKRLVEQQQNKEIQEENSISWAETGRLALKGAGFLFTAAATISLAAVGISAAVVGAAGVAGATLASTGYQTLIAPKLESMAKDTERRRSALAATPKASEFQALLKRYQNAEETLQRARARALEDPGSDEAAENLGQQVEKVRTLMDQLYHLAQTVAADSKDLLGNFQRRRDECERFLEDDRFQGRGEESVPGMAGRAKDREAEWAKYQREVTAFTQSWNSSTWKEFSIQPKKPTFLALTDELNYLTDRFRAGSKVAKEDVEKAERTLLLLCTYLALGNSEIATNPRGNYTNFITEARTIITDYMNDNIIAAIDGLKATTATPITIDEIFKKVDGKVNAVFGPSSTCGPSKADWFVSNYTFAVKPHPTDPPGEDFRTSRSSEKGNDDMDNTLTVKFNTFATCLFNDVKQTGNNEGDGDDTDNEDDNTTKTSCPQLENVYYTWEADAKRRAKKLFESKRKKITEWVHLSEQEQDITDLGVPDLLRWPQGTSKARRVAMEEAHKKFTSFGQTFPGLSTLSQKLGNEFTRWLDAKFQNEIRDHFREEWKTQFSDENLDYVCALLAEYVYCFRLLQAVDYHDSNAKTNTSSTTDFDERHWREISLKRYALSTMDRLRPRAPASRQEKKEFPSAAAATKPSKTGGDQDRKGETEEHERTLRAELLGLPRGEVGYSCRDLKEAVRDGLDDFMYQWLGMQKNTQTGRDGCESYSGQDLEELKQPKIAGHQDEMSPGTCFEKNSSAPQCVRCDRVLGQHRESIYLFQLQYLMCGEISADTEPLWECGLTQGAATSYFVNLSQAYRETGAGFFRNEQKKALLYLRQLMSAPLSSHEHQSRTLIEQTKKETYILCMFTSIVSSLKARTPSMYESAKQDYVPFLHFYLSSQLS